MSYFFTPKTSAQRKDITLASSKMSTTRTEKIACMSYYLARCGDGVVDKTAK
jgi:hypothetical protein